MATKTITGGCVNPESDPPNKIKFGNDECDSSGHFEGCIVPSGQNIGKVKVEISRCLKVIYPFNEAAQTHILEQDISGQLKPDTDYVLTWDMKQVCWQGDYQENFPSQRRIRIDTTGAGNWGGDRGCYQDGEYHCAECTTPGHKEATFHTDDPIAETQTFKIFFYCSVDADGNSAGWICDEFCVIDNISLKESGSEIELLSNGDFASGMTDWEWGDPWEEYLCAGTGVSAAACDGAFYGCVDPETGLFEVELPDTTCW